jgi:6-phosphogluconolactonase/glucosamine-6-phosphate isomerase/deaminase
MYLQKHLILPLNIDASRVLLLDGAAGNLDTECKRYEDEIRRPGGEIDVSILGLGLNGHVAFNEPPSDEHSLTRYGARDHADCRVINLTQESIETAKGDFPRRPEDRIPNRVRDSHACWCHHVEAHHRHSPLGSRPL